MDYVAAWSKQDRQDLFAETANRRKLAPTIIEKDFWVCWTLKHVFSLPMAPHLLFKGGTSLSKVFGVIQRFSEDIDLSIHRDYLGFGGSNDPMLLPSASKRDPQLAKLVQACEANIRDEFLPQLLASFETVLGTAETWGLTLDPDDLQTVLFTYPTAHSAPMPGMPARNYIAPIVRLEMGARSDPYPTGTHPITPYAAEEYPDQFEQPSYNVNVLEAERTFWEKATILHAEFHRPEGSRANERISRHYYDLAQLAETPIAERALGDLTLLERVATHKKVFFRAGWAKYDEARSGSLRLVPPAARIEAIRRDYASMSEMFFGDQPAFDAIIGTL